MKKYSILIVGLKCYYGHLIEVITNLKKTNPLVDITLVSSSIPDRVIKELSGYVNQIVVCEIHQNNIIPRFLASRLNPIFCYLKLLRLHLKSHFDIVNIHFATPNVKYAMPILKKMSKNIVISPWGSDVMRVEDEKVINELSKIYSQARYVTNGKDSQIGQCVVEKFKVDPEKMVKLGWGGEFFDFIQENSKKVTTKEAKDRFGLSDRYVITCGYNTQRAQRHEDIIDAIYSVKDQLPRNLTLLLPCTYVFFKGKSTGKEQYVVSLKEKCKALGLDVVIVEEHLDLADLLKLRMATDIFVHIQSSDAGSRSVMEYVACNKKLVHGAWVRYRYLNEYKPSCYFPVDQIEDLGACIVKAYHSEVGELPQEVKEVIKKRGWNYKISLWNEFFESLVP